MTLPDFVHSDRIALFLDFDGTIAAIADHPDEVVLDPPTRNALAELDRLLDGALAIITGRDIAAVDRFLAPLHLPVAGVHGLTRRDVQGRIYAPTKDSSFAAVIERSLGQFVKERDGLLLERKHSAIALHYRAHPELEGMCIAAMEKAIAAHPRAELKRGRMVIEAKITGGDKGAAIADYLREKPFLGRRPIVAGDDLTDEDAFALVNKEGGVSIKIGSGKTNAKHQVASIQEFLAWLTALPSKLRG